MTAPAVRDVVAFEAAAKRLYITVVDSAGDPVYLEGTFAAEVRERAGDDPAFAWTVTRTGLNQLQLDLTGAQTSAIALLWSSAVWELAGDVYGPILGGRFTIRPAVTELAASDLPGVAEEITVRLAERITVVATAMVGPTGLPDGRPVNTLLAVDADGALAWEPLASLQDAATASAVGMWLVSEADGDAGAQINAVIEAAATAFGVSGVPQRVVLSAGQTYEASTPIVLAGNVEVHVPATTTIQAVSGVGTALIVIPEGAVNPSITGGGTIDGGDVTARGVRSELGCTNPLIEGLTFTGATSHDIDFNDAVTGGRIAGCRFEDNFGTSCVRVRGTCTRVAVEGNEFSGWRNYGVEVRASTVYPSYCTVAGNYFHDAAELSDDDYPDAVVAAKQSIVAYGSSASIRCQGLRVLDNVIVGLGRPFGDPADNRTQLVDGILVGGNGDQVALHYVDAFEVRGNISIGGGEIGISITRGTQGGVAADNICTGNDGHGMQVGRVGETQTAIGVVVVGNVLNDNGINGTAKVATMAGLFIQNGRDCVVTGNVANDTRATPLMNYGFMFGGCRGTVHVGNGSTGCTLGHTLGGTSAYSFRHQPSIVDLAAANQLRADVRWATERRLDVQRISIGLTVTAGTWTVTYAGQTTAPIAWNANAAAIQAAIEALSTVGAGNVAVQGGFSSAFLDLGDDDGGAGARFSLRWKGALAGVTTLVTVNDSLLTGGSITVQSAPRTERWRLTADGSNETGSNAGSNLRLERITDEGFLVSRPITVDRSTGIVDLDDGLRVGRTSSSDSTAARVGRRFVRRSTDAPAINNSTVLVSDTVLVIPMAAGAVYTFDAWIAYDVTQVADLKIGWLVPAGTTMHWAGGGIQEASTSTTGNAAINRRLWTEAQTAVLGGAAAGTPVVATASGLIVVGSTAGDLTLQRAQATAEVSDAIIKAGSWVKLERVA